MFHWGRLVFTPSTFVLRRPVCHRLRVDLRRSRITPEVSWTVLDGIVLPRLLLCEQWKKTRLNCVHIFKETLCRYEVNEQELASPVGWSPRSRAVKSLCRLCCLGKNGTITRDYWREEKESVLRVILHLRLESEVLHRRAVDIHVGIFLGGLCWQVFILACQREDRFAVRLYTAAQERCRLGWTYTPCW